jgi:hypothetical protein
MIMRGMFWGAISGFIFGILMLYATLNFSVGPPELGKTAYDLMGLPQTIGYITMFTIFGGFIGKLRERRV